ncbi:MAG TPA: T9SS type A sorting domain-containing protein [Candidatus Kapabacteria bacterium]|nr:T9SS type A sorting domain-containing protein [Candidatus Kapabacteria bacterium]
MKKLYYILAVSLALVVGSTVARAQGEQHDNGLHLGEFKEHHHHHGDDGNNGDDDNGNGGGIDTIIIIVHDNDDHGDTTKNHSDTTKNHSDSTEDADDSTKNTGGGGAGGALNAHQNPFGLSDTCLIVFESKLSADTAKIVINDLATIDSNKTKLDTLIARYRLIKKTKDSSGKIDTLKLDSLKAQIKTLDQATLAIWQQLVQIGVAEGDILAQVHTDCGGDSSTIGKKNNGALVAVNVSAASPNPLVVGGTSKFNVTSSATGPISIGLFDEMGVQVKDVLESTITANMPLAVSFDASGLKSGAYILRVQTGNTVQSQKIIVN